jgi:hypothetical protein
MNVGKLWMWSYWKMKSTTFIHNDGAKCFHVVIQGTHKLVVMGCINFEDHALINKRWASKKMNALVSKFKDEKNGIIVKSNLCLLLEVVRVFKVLEFIVA